MWKRTLLIIIVLTLLGLGAWYFFGQPSPAKIGEKISNVLPFGVGEGGNSSGSTTPRGTRTTPGTSTSHLYKISDTPVAGAIAFIKNGILEVRYVDRATGHVFEVDPVSLAKTEITNNTVPKVYEAVWRPDGAAVLLRTLEPDTEVIDTVSISLTPPAGTSTSDLYSVKASGLPANISAISVGQKNVFYISKDQSLVATSLFDGTKPTAIWNPAFNEWQVRAVSDTVAVLTTNAAASINGYSYSLTTKGALTKLLGPLPGLTALMKPDQSRIIYSYNNNGNLILQSKKLAKGSVTNLIPATITDKCVWSNKDTQYGTIFCAVPKLGFQKNEPDSWYLGLSHYSDAIWRFDADTEFSEMVVDPKKEFGADLDVENPFLSPNEDYLFFQDKNTLLLWALKLDSH